MTLDSDKIKAWFEEILPSPIKWSGDEGITRCPLATHDGPDRNPSFSVNALNGTWYCHKESDGGGIKELARRLEVEPPFLDKWDKQKPIKKREVATYDYRDDDNRVVYQSVRLEPGDNGKSKTFRQRRPNLNKPGGWVWEIRGIKPLPYRLPELIKAINSGEIVFVVEGEKDVDNLAGVGVVATTNHGSAGKWSNALGAGQATGSSPTSSTGRSQQLTP